MTPIRTLDLILITITTWAIIVSLECMFLHVRQGGRLKRGIKIWSEPLPQDMKHFLRRLPYDLVNDDETGAFIRKENNAILVQYLHTNKFWSKKATPPYVAYIDLRARNPRIQYRIPISPLPFFVLWFSIAIWGSFQYLEALPFAVLGIVMLYISHTIQRKRILRFIEETMQTLDV